MSSDQGPTGGETPWWARPDGGEAPSWWQDSPGGAGGPGGPGGQAGGGWGAPTGPRFEDHPPPTAQGAPFSARPDPAYYRTRAVQPTARAKGAVTALVVGILSLVCCGIVLGPVAIYQGSQARYRIRASNGRLGGDGMALAGMVLGGVAIGLFLLGVVLAATGHRIIDAPTTTTTP